MDQVCYGYGHIVMLHDVAICKTPSRNIVMPDACQWKPSKFEQLSDIHKERALKNAVEVSKHVDNHGVIGVDL